MKDLLDGTCILYNEYVILDEKGRYIPLEDYEGQVLYLSESIEEKERNCRCPEGAWCEPCPLYIAGLYAYNPRPVIDLSIK